MISDYKSDTDDLESIRAHAKLVTEDDAVNMLAKAREAGKVFHLTDIGKELYDKFAPVSISFLWNHWRAKLWKREVCVEFIKVSRGIPGR